jgi:hypothetical protein
METKHEHEDESEEPSVSIEVAVLIIVIFVIVMAILAYLGWQKIFDYDVPSPESIIPLVGVFNLFKDSQKMTAVGRRQVREQRRVVTKKLFTVIIYAVIWIGILGFAFSALGRMP